MILEFNITNLNVIGDDTTWDGEVGANYVVTKGPDVSKD
jgi:hypothetical protein